MKINFIVPTLNLTGGIRVVSIYAKLLQERGHDITVISPGKPKPSYLKRIKSYLKGKGWSAGVDYSSAFFDTLNVNLLLLEQHRAIEEQDVPDADVIIATFWNSAEWIASFSPTKGKKIYFIQHHEVHPWMPIERVKATLQPPYKKIVVAQWLADVLKLEYGDDSAIVVSNGVDHKQFFSGNRTKNTIPVFGMMYSSRSFKGCDLAIACIAKARLLHRLHPNIKFVAFGTEYLNVDQLPMDTEYFVQPE